MTNLNGSLSYRKDSNSFFINETGTNDGWVPLPISVNAKDLSTEDLKSLAERLGGGSKYQLYVDVDNPNASDAKDNTGISKLTPFKSLERALLEVARRSFRTPAQEARLGADGDSFERYTINLAPGEYTIENTPGGFASIGNYPDYQIASNLIQRNRTWIVAESLGVTSGLSSENSNKLQQDLNSWVLALASDLSSLSNNRTLLESRKFLNSDKNVVCTNPLSPPNNYFVGMYTSLSVRQQAVLALQELKLRAIDSAKNLGFVTDPDVNIDPLDALQIQIYNRISEFVDILIDTLNCTLDPRFSFVESFGLPSKFPETGEPSKNFYVAFNDPATPGVILPRGVSIIGVDLRKVVIRPAYVPDYSNPLASKGSVFKMTGGNFFSGFTIKDKKGHELSHHMLTAFEFSSYAELDSYYEKVRVAFTDKSIYHRAQDAANLLEKNLDWVSRKSIPSIVQQSEINYATVLEGEMFFITKAIVSDLRSIDKKNVEALGKRFHLTHIQPISSPADKAEAQAFYKDALDDAKLYIRDAINNEANPAEGGVIDESIIVDTSPGSRCSDVVSAIYSYIDIIKNHIDGLYVGDVNADEFSDSDIDPYKFETNIVADYDFEDPLLSVGESVNTVLGASPYIFSASVRSEYGLNGIDGDGSKVKGLKSYLAAQFTVISLQKDPNAFIEDTDEVGDQRYKGSKKTDSVADFRHFGYRVSNGAYSQLVSCFCICPAIHYWAQSGGEFSITNSTSNFGDISLYSEGFLRTSFPQDKGLKVAGVLKPAPLPFTNDITQADNFTLGSILSATVLEQGTDPSYDEEDKDRFANRLEIILNRESTILDNFPNFSDPTKTNYVYVQSQFGVDFRRARVESVVRRNEDGYTKLVLTDLQNSWPIEPQQLQNNGGVVKPDYDSVIIGRQVYFKRYVDTRSAEDRQYYVVLANSRDPLTKSLGGKRRPVVHYSITKDAPDPQPFNLNDLRKSFFVLRAPVVEDPNTLSTTPVYSEPTLDANEFYLVKLGANKANALGFPDFDIDLDFTSRISDQLDVDPLELDVESDLELNNLTPSRENVSTFLDLLGVTGVNLNITTNRYVNVLSQGVLVKTNKPSIIRCGGQTWEYMGYYNYRTGLPFAQVKQLGQNLSVQLQKLKRIEKTQTFLLGGRIYATGMDEEGNSYVGNTFQDLKTGETEEIIRGSSIDVLSALGDNSLPSSVKFTAISIESDNSSPTFIADSADRSIKFGDSTSVEFGADSIFISPPPATNDVAGTVAIATLDDINLRLEDKQIDSKRYPLAITPKGLDQWRVANKITSQISNAFRVYVSGNSRHSLASTNPALLDQDPGLGLAVDYQAFKTNIEDPDETVVWQLSDPEAVGFRCLENLEEVTKYINENLTTNDTLTLFIDPGKYQADFVFNCALVINGANNLGALGFGNPDGTSTPQNGSGVILYSTLRFSRILTQLDPDGYSVASTSITLNHNSTSQIQYVHFMHGLEAVKDSDIEFKPDAITGTKLKEIGDNSFETFLSSVNNYLNTTYPSDFPYTDFNRLYSIDLPPAFVLSGSGRVNFYHCTFGGGGYTTLFRVSDSKTLRLFGNTLRGNVETRMSLNHLTKRSSGVLMSNINPSTKKAINIYANNSGVGDFEFADLATHYVDPYDPAGAQFCFGGFCKAVITVSQNRTLNLSLGSPDFSGNTTKWGLLEAGVSTTSNLASTSETTTINHDFKNAFRLEKYSQSLFGTTDDRILSGQTSANTPVISLFFRGTDNLGTYITNPSYNTVDLTNQTLVENFISDYMDQGPIISQFLSLNYNSKLNFALSENETSSASYQSYMPNRDTSDLCRSQGILGSFGRKVALTESLNISGLGSVAYPSNFPSSYPYSNTLSTSIFWQNSYHKNAFYPAWRGFTQGKYTYPVIIDADLNRVSPHKTYSQFLTYLNSTDPEDVGGSATIAYDYSKFIPLIVASGYNLDNVPPYTQFIVVWTSTSEVVPLYYLGKISGNHIIIPRGSTVNIGLTEYFEAKSASRIYDDFDAVIADVDAGDINNGEVIYLKDFNLLLERRAKSTVSYTNIGGWRPITIDRAIWQRYNKPGEELVLNNLSRLGLFSSRLSNNFSAEKFGYQLSTYSVSGISSIPTDTTSIYSTLGFPTSVYTNTTQASDAFEALQAYYSIGSNFYSKFAGTAINVVAESIDSFHTDITI
jgi:hypothetical protein